MKAVQARYTPLGMQGVCDSVVSDQTTSPSVYNTKEKCRSEVACRKHEYLYGSGERLYGTVATKIHAAPADRRFSSIRII